MNELRVVFAEAPDNGYRAQLADAEGHRLGVEAPFTPFLSEDDYEDLRWYLEEYMDLPDGGAVVRAQRIERELERWGSQLYEALFTEADNRSCLRELLDGPEPRRLTIATRDAALLRLPWELLADEKGSLAQRLSVRRQLEEPETTTPRPAQLPLRILYIVSRPADTGFIDPRFTAKALLDALDPLGASVRVDFCRPPTLARMEEMLYDGQQAGDPYAIVHFDGHGTFRPDEQVGGLFFERFDSDLSTSADFVSAVRIGQIFVSYKIPLVILEACRSATLGETTVLGSVAPLLIQVGVDSVLAMSHAVHIEATRLLLDRFYRELVRGNTIGQAMAEAREVLRSTPVRWIESGPVGRTIELCDWFLPQLYQSAADDALVPSGASADAEESRGFRSPATRDEPGSFPPSPQFGFRGRARELHVLERLFRSRRGIVLHAMGGMGKTALATEAAHWWTRSGLFRDGACFLSFEQFASADRVVQVLGTYLEGPRFEQLSAVEQRRRVIELFQQKAVLMVLDNFESALPQFDGGRKFRGGLRKWLARVLELIKRKPAIAAPQNHASPYTDDERRRLAKLFRDLTTGPGKGCILVTCRPGDTGLPGTQRYELRGLARADSLWLLASILRRDGITLDDPRLSRDKLDPLLRDLADHPLSLELVGPHLRTLTPEAIRADFGKLLAEQHEAPEERNRSLLASLEFSRRHLSPVAREALPWLGLFSGGVFEDLLLDVSELAPETWQSIRQELQGIALLRVEDDLQIGDRPFLRFHPTLASVAVDPTLAQKPEIRQRFLSTYHGFMEALNEALLGSGSGVALEALKREEESYRTAVQWAIADLQFPAASALGHTFCEYLKRLGRLRERDIWVQWLKNEINQQIFTPEAAAYEQENAWTRFTQGDPQGAIDRLQTLIERLRNTENFDPSFELVVSAGMLGRVLSKVGDFAQAISILWEAASHWEALVEKAEGCSWKELLAHPEDVKVSPQLHNLAATMSDLSEALRYAGRYQESLIEIENCIKIQRALGNQREVASAESHYAEILRIAGRYAEAEALNDSVLINAREVGDKELEAVILQHQGTLADKRRQHELARHLYQQAIKILGEMGDDQGVMYTYNLLGGSEQEAGRLPEAQAWFGKSRELAEQLKDPIGLGQAAQNIGIIWQLSGEEARENGDETAALLHFNEALRSIEESLRAWQAQKNKPYEAAAWFQLARVHFRLSDLPSAERHANEARQIYEALEFKEAWMVYDTLSEITEARGNLAAAAEWAKKRDDLLAEFNSRAGGGGDLSAHTLHTLQRLTLACAQAGFEDGSFGPAEEEALAQLDGLPAPYPDFAAFLRHIAAGQVAPIPGGLPEELREWVEELVEEIREAQG